MQFMQSVRIVYPVAVLPTKKKIEKCFAARFIRELSGVFLSRVVTQTCASHFPMWRSPGSPRSRARNGRNLTFSPAQRTIREANWRASPQCLSLVRSLKRAPRTFLCGVAPGARGREHGKDENLPPAQRTIREANWRASPQCCQLESLRYSSIVRYIAIHDVSRNID